MDGTAQASSCLNESSVSPRLSTEVVMLILDYVDPIDVLEFRKV